MELLHRRLGHGVLENTVSGLQNQRITGYKVEAKCSNGKWEMENGVCEPCMLGKSKRASFPDATTPKAIQPGELVVCDIMGPFAYETLGQERYALTYTDWYTRYSWTYLMVEKSEALTHLKHLVEVVFKAARIELRYR